MYIQLGEYKNRIEIGRVHSPFNQSSTWSSGAPPGSVMEEEAGMSPNTLRQQKLEKQRALLREKRQRQNQPMMVQPNEERQGSGGKSRRRQTENRYHWYLHLAVALEERDYKAKAIYEMVMVMYVCDTLACIDGPASSVYGLNNSGSHTTIQVLAVGSSSTDDFMMKHHSLRKGQVIDLYPELVD
ncbi:putative tubby protein-like [Apostichopus japonicus]|uniref:Putative tubby protein-like n=1 Tax=Stichopus japonicus TaxID=307972 RepID=A0A2G8JET9_STIJA|nr:putative tubby protein-like [Apostichopus japonicus]